MKANPMRIAMMATLLVTAAFPAWAHAGAGAGVVSGFVHPLQGLDHLLAMVAVGVWAAQLGRRAVLLLPLVFPAVMALGAALAIGGFALPLVETAIAVSLIVLALVTVLGARPRLLASAAVVGGFALFHGHAHGSEIPDAVSPLGYGLGFIAATLLLHMLGVGIGLVLKKPLPAPRRSA